MDPKKRPNDPTSKELLQIAEAIADGRDTGAIDWDRARGDAEQSGEGDLVDAFVDVAAIAQAHREFRAPPRGEEVGKVLRGRDGRAYRLLEELGRGGMGVVFKATDDSGRTVALKRLRSDRKVSVGRFKREFRSLVTLSDEPENLATLYHLDTDEEGAPFFTMELVDGTDFVSYARGATPAGAPPDGERLRAALVQLVRGVSALHAKAKLHRDLKPSNVLVTPSGKVVVVDFGLAADATDTDTTATDVLGTPAYMAPEQAEGRAGTGASDLYGVGVILFEALTGQLPFRGSVYDILDAKRSWEPTVPDVGLPLLETLCRELMSIDAAERPGVADALRRLGAEAPAPEDAHELFIGRDAELALLETLYQQQSSSRTSVVLLHGPSGVGKTALIERFLRQHARDENTALLRGRCFERESVPYKALDSLVDHLTRYLRRVEAKGRESVHTYLPSDMTALARVFPAFDDIHGARELVRRGRAVGDLQELRKRAFDALRELLAKVGQRKKTVLVIDDLQWGDADSAAVLATLLRPPNPPPFLLVGCYRDSDVEASPLLPELHRMASGGSWAAEVHDLRLGQLSAEDAEALAASLLVRTSARTPGLARDIAKESGGIPLFIAELARYVRHPPTTPTLEQALRARIAALDDAARDVLEIVAVAGKPVASAAVEKASGAEHRFPDARIALESTQLMRSLGSGEIEIYHDRIRQAVLARIPETELTRLHLRLAHAFPPTTDPETLAVHFELGGERKAAMAFTEKAAERAARALAFDRAARLYRKALELNESAESLRLRIALGDSLANGGHGLEASGVYVDAMAEADVVTAIGLHRRAAEQLLMAGHIDAGARELEAVLRKLGIRSPRSVLGAVLSLLLTRPFRRGRSYRFRERPEGEIEPLQLLEVDSLYTAVKCLGLVDNLRGAAFQADHLNAALRVGEPYRVCRAWAMHALYLSAAGPERQGEALQLVQEMEDLAKRLDHPYPRALAPLIRGMTSLFQGRWSEALDLLKPAEGRLSDYGTGVTYEIDMARMFSCYALFQKGRWGTLFEMLPGLLEDAARRGDHFANTNLRLRYAWLHALAQNRTDVARFELERATEGWSQRFTTQHYLEAKAHAEIALYEQDADAATAHEVCERAWAAVRRSRLLRVQYLRIDALDLRGRAAIAHAISTSRPNALDLAEKNAELIDREETEWGTPLAVLLRAGVHSARGERESARAELQSAARGLERAGMELRAAVGRRRLGELLGGDDGRAAVEAADDAITAEGIRAPDEFAFLLAPGRWRE